MEAVQHEEQQVLLLREFLDRVFVSLRLLNYYLTHRNYENNVGLIIVHNNHMTSELALQASLSAVCSDIALRFFTKCLYRNVDVEPPLRFRYGEKGYRFATEKLDLCVQFYVDLGMEAGQIVSRAVKLLAHGVQLECSETRIQVAFPVLIGEQKLPQNTNTTATRKDM